MTISDTKNRMTDEDIAVLKAMFEDREGAVEAIRKIFFPTLDAENPIHANSDMWSGSMFTLEGLTAEQKVIAIESHIKLVKHVEGCFAVIKQIVGTKGETLEQTLARVNQNSSK